MAGVLKGGKCHVFGLTQSQKPSGQSQTLELDHLIFLQSKSGHSTYNMLMLMLPMLFYAGQAPIACSSADLFYNPGINQ